MTRVLSALVLLPIVVGTIWFLPAYATLILALVAAILAHYEFAAIAKALGATLLPGSGSAVVLACASAVSPAAGLFLMSALIVVGAGAVAFRQPGPGVVSDVAASLLSPIYIGLPLGALAAVRADSEHGREAILLLLVVIVVSDSAQYYTGRAFGKHKLSPTISPKKTVEGAIGGVLFGTAAMTFGGRFVLPSPMWMLALLGAAIAMLGIVGDLFESLLKRSAGVKDSSNLIPGHGGVLDRIDSWLFAAPIYYVFVRFVAS